MLEELQARLGRLGRPHTAADVATAMRGMGLVVSDTALREAMDQLRRNSVGAGPLEELLREPGCPMCWSTARMRCSSTGAPG